MKKMLWPVVAALTFAPMGGGFARQADCDSCSVSLRTLDLRQAPSDGELIRSGQLGGALSPTEVKTPASAADRWLFGQAMDAWNRHDYQTAVPLFKKHLAAYSNSAWRGEAELHLGCEDRFNGRYTQAERYFRQILADRGTAGYGDDIACKARLRLAMLEFMRGNFDQAEAMWTEMSQVDPDRRRRDHARHWLMRASLYKTEAKWVRRCAVESLVCLLQASGKAGQADRLVGMPANADYGFRADELAALSAQCGLPLQGVQAQNTVGLPTPFIAHYRFNHFVTVTGRDAAGNLQLFDPILNHAVTMTPEAFGVEWSGLALVPADRLALFNFSQLTVHCSLLTANALRAFVGGCCGVENVNRDEGCNTGKVGGTMGNGRGMPVWGFTPISMNVFAKDTPLWYEPAVGPAVEFRMAYNSIDADASLPSFGPKWFFGYHSYIIETPASGGGSVTVFMPDGRNDVYSPIAGTNTFTAPARVFDKLTKLGTNQFNLLLPEGTTWQYGAPEGAPDVQQALLKKIVDRHGNAVSLLYTNEPEVQLTAVVDALSQTSRLYYADSGVITNIVDPFGRSASFAYSSNAYLAAVTDMGGVTSEFEFYESEADDGYIKALRTHEGLVTFTYEFQNADWNGMWRRQRVTATFTNGSTQILYYNGGEDGNPSTFFTDRNGHKTRYKIGLNSAFPHQGTIVYADAPDGSRVSYLYNTALQPTNVTDEAGNGWSFAYNSVGRPTQLREPNGYQVALAYTNGGFDVASMTEGTNLLLTLSYTTNRDVTAATNALGQSTRFGYDNLGRITNTVDALGITNTLTYGTDSRLSAVKRAGAVLFSIKYDAAGRATNSVGSEGVAVSAAYDNLGRISMMTLPGESPYRWTYGTNSLLLSRFVDRSGRGTAFAYDAMNRLSSVKGPDLVPTLFEYNSDGDLTGIVDALVRRTRFQYDTRNRTVGKTYPDGKSNQVAWTTRSLPTSFMSPRGITTTYGFTSAGLLTNVAYVGTTNTSGLQFAYDSLNRVTNAVDGWSTNVLTYDVFDRVVQAKEIQGAFTQTFAYAFDAIGRTTNVTWQAGTNAAVSTTYQFDSLDRVTNVTSDMGSFGYQYVSNGVSVKMLRYPNGDMADYVYDGLRRLTNLSFRLQYIWTPTGRWGYRYNARDQVVSRTDPATNRFEYKYDEAGRLTEATAATSVTGYPCRYAYDWAGNRTRQTEGTRQRSLAVNDNNQLVSVGRSNLASVAGYVNEAGTCTVVQVRSSETGAWTRIPTKFLSYTQGWFQTTVVVTNAGTNTIWIKATDKAGNTSTQTVHVLSSSTNAAYAWDADGNLTNKPGAAFEWDAENRPVRIAYADNSQTLLRYDGAGRLREVAEYNYWGGLSVTRYAWNGWLPIAELDGSNRIVRTFTWGLDVSGTVGGAGGIGGLVGIRDRAGSGTNYIVRTDGKGNVTEVRTSGGTVVASYRYAPFGALLTSSGTYNQPFRFQSKIWHGPSGLGYWGMRWYDPATAKWISRDGLGEAGGLNLYEYCAENPLAFFDPDGDAWSAIEAHGYWSDVAITGQDAGGVAGNLQTAGASVMVSFLDFWGARDVESSAGLSGCYSGTDASRSQAWESGFKSLALVGIAAMPGGRGIKGVTVIGRYPGYIRVAEQMGANFLKVGKWNWQAQGQFIKEVIARGDDVLIGTPVGGGQSILRKEIRQLVKAGYTAVRENGQIWLRKP